MLTGWSPSKEAARGLADGTLKFADARKGDASVLIKETATGSVSEHAALKRVGTSAKTVGPLILWEAMAMATQQHFLVEINDKLAGIEKGVDELLQRMDDHKRGTLKQVRKVTEAARRNLGEGREPSEARRDELRRGLLQVDAIWHQLRERAARHLDGYRRGTSSNVEVEDAWAMLLFATQVLSETGSLLTSLPFDSVRELEAATAEERERVLGAIDDVQMLAADLHAAHVEWSATNAEYHLRRTRNPARTLARTIRKDVALAPPVAALDGITAWRARQLALTPTPPTALLITVAEDDSLSVSVERPGVAALI